MTALLKQHRYFAALLLVSFGLHSLLASIPPLNGDEATFWEWSRHLAFGYYAHPPMTAWLVAIFTHLFGIYPYIVRLASILLHLGTTVFVYLIALEIARNQRSALLSAVIYSVMPQSIVLGTAMTTDSSLIFGFTAAVYFVKKAMIELKSRYWYAAAVSCGAMLLSKFMAVLFFPGLFFFILFSRKYRQFLIRKEPYLALLGSLVIFSPFLIWNMQNNWLTFQFNFFMRHKDQSGSLLDPLKYLAGQMIAAAPILFLALIAAIATLFCHLLKKPSLDVNEADDAVLLLCYMVGFPLLFFLLVSFRTEVGAHWAGIIYPLASILITFWLYSTSSGELRSNLQRIKTFWLGISLSALISAAICVVVLFPKILPDRLIYTTAVFDDAPILSHYFGWQEVGQRIDELKKEWDSQPEGLFLTSKDYSLASMLGFYTPSHPNFYLMNVTKDIIHGKSFLIWEKGKKRLGANTLFVSDTPDSYQSRIPGFFKDYQLLKPLVIRDENGRILRIFYFTVGLHYLGGEPDNLSLW